MPKNYEYTLVTTENELEELISDLSTSTHIGLDIETTSLQPQDGKIRLIQVSTGTQIYIVDLFKVERGAISGLITALMVYKGVVIGHFLTFETKWFLHHFSVYFARIFDTFRASKLIYNGDEGITGYNLWVVETRELNIDHKDDPDLAASTWDGELTPEQLNYAAGDVAHMHALREALVKKLVQAKLVDVAKIEFDVVPAEAHCELSGIGFDAEGWRKIYERVHAKQQELGQIIRQKLPNPNKQLSLFDSANDWNIDSNQQMLAALQMVGADIKDTSEVSLSMSSHPTCAIVREYRHLDMRTKTFGLDWIRHVGKDGRVRADYRAFTGAGRYSCAKPNLQQLPRDKEYRACFRPRPGCKFIICDYSAIELRIAAEVSGDENLIDVFLRGEDPHTATARMISGKQDIGKKSPERQAAKPVNFGFIYGMGAEKFVKYAKMSYNVDVTLAKAHEIRDKFFKAYPGLLDWHRRATNSANKREARTLSGRRRFLMQDAYSQCLNTPVQGTGADGLKKSLRYVFEGIYGTDVLIAAHVHDEIVLDAPIECANWASNILEKAMMKGMQGLLKRVPCAVEIKIADDWSEK